MLFIWSRHTLAYSLPSIICTSPVSIHAERCVSQITWQSEDDPAYTRQWINVGWTLVQRRRQGYRHYTPQLISMIFESDCHLIDISTPCFPISLSQAYIQRSKNKIATEGCGQTLGCHCWCGFFQGYNVAHPCGGWCWPTNVTNAQSINICPGRLLADSIQRDMVTPASHSIGVGRPMGIAGGSTGRVNGKTRLSFTILFLSSFLPRRVNGSDWLHNSSSVHYIYLSRHKTSAMYSPAHDTPLG